MFTKLNEDLLSNTFFGSFSLGMSTVNSSFATLLKTVKSMKL